MESREWLIEWRCNCVCAYVDGKIGEMKGTGTKHRERCREAEMKGRKGGTKWEWGWTSRLQHNIAYGTVNNAESKTTDKKGKRIESLNQQQLTIWQLTAFPHAAVCAESCVFTERIKQAHRYSILKFNCCISNSPIGIACSCSLDVSAANLVFNCSSLYH